MLDSLKIAIGGYILGMALVSDAQPIVHQVPMTCFPGENIIKGYEELGVFKPLFLAQNDSAMIVGFVDPSDGELHLWAIVEGVPCVIDRTMLKRWNNEVLTIKPSL
jgi:hypothetical protein